MDCNIVNSTILFDYYATCHLCSGWRLEEEPRIHDPNTRTAIIPDPLLGLGLCIHPNNASTNLFRPAL